MQPYWITIRSPWSQSLVILGLSGYKSVRNVLLKLAYESTNRDSGSFGELLTRLFLALETSLLVFD